ncbi:MAG: hypothetical protein OEQ74_02610 [Gammaproteobacteria bacterium]|nr:hypothetical protein [Gammaproteobacteria bacterium]
MSILVTEETEAAVSPAAGNIVHVETRFSIVHDALVNERSHRDDAIDQFLAALYSAFGDFRVDGPDNEPLDVRILNTLTAMKPLRDYFLEFVNLANKADRRNDIHSVIRPFLGTLLAYKHAPREVIHFNHLWCDHYRFVLRELFIHVIASLIVDCNYEEARKYLEAEYLFETDRGPQRANFLKFDAYIKSIDEFQTRRLRQQRLSPAADLLKARADRSFVSFGDIMQADFLLCIRGLMHHQKGLARWFPSTLIYAQEFEKTGFDLFFAAQSKKKFQPIHVLLDVRNKKDLLQRFEQVSKDCSLAQWKLGEVPIPFDRYMGLAALATA